MSNMSYFSELRVGYIWEILMRLHQDLKGKFLFIQRQARVGRLMQAEASGTLKQAVVSKG